MGVSIEGGAGEPWPPWIFIHCTDIVDRGLIVLFSVFFSIFFRWKKSGARIINYCNKRLSIKYFRGEGCSSSADKGRGFIQCKQGERGVTIMGCP